MDKENTIIGGLQELSRDVRDLQLGALIKWPKLSELPLEYLPEPFSIKDQISDGNFDFCGSCAGAGMIEPKEETELFYPFLFAASKHASKQNPDSFGLNIRDVGKGLTKWGVPETTDVPKEIKDLLPEKRRRFENYPESLRIKALKHKAQSYFFVNGPYDHYDNARAIEWYFRKKKQHITIGVVFGWFISDFYLNGLPKGTGHAMWLAGWFSEGLRVVNSAGKNAGKGGIHCLSRKTFNHYAEKYGMMMITDMPRGQAEYYHTNKIRIDQNWICELFQSFKNLFKK